MAEIGVQKTTARPSIKTAAAKSARRGGCVPSYAHVLGLVQDDESRSALLDEFRRLGGQRDRWATADWVAMAAALTRVEDAWEMGYPRRDRSSLGTARRQLEDATVNVR